MFGYGHPSEHLIWAPDSRDDLAFTMYATDCEHEKAMQEAREAMSNKIFLVINDVSHYLEATVPNAYYQLSNSDIRDLFYSQYSDVCDLF